MKSVKIKRVVPGIVYEQSMVGWGQGLTAQQAGDVVKGWTNALTSHELAMPLSIVTAFIPVIGLALSSGIALLDAGKYYQEGDRLNAGSMAVFALLPGIGSIASKIPGIKKLGSYGMAQLGKKLATSKNPVLTKLEMAIVKDMSKHSKYIKTEMNSYFKARVANELSRRMLRSTASSTKKILMKIADGTLTASVAGTKLAGVLATYDAADQAWNKAYKKLGFDRFDKIDYEFTGLDDLKKRYAKKENKIMKSDSMILDQIIKTSLAEQLQLDNPNPTQPIPQKQPIPKDEGYSRGTWIIIFLLVGLVGGTGLLYRLGKFFYKKGVSFAYILRGGKIRDIIKQWKNKGGVKSAQEAIEEMYANKKIDSKQRQELLDALENPAITRELEREFFNLSKSAFERGEINADEFLATLEPEVRKKYESLIRDIEKRRGTGKATKAAGTGTSRVFTRINPVTEKQFDSVISKNESLLKKIYSISEMIAYKEHQMGPIVDDLKALKRELTNPTKGLARFKDEINTIEEYIQKCKEHNVKLPTNYNDLQERWKRYQIKQLF